MQTYKDKMQIFFNKKSGRRGRFMNKEKALITINQAELIDSIYSKYKTIYTRKDIKNILSALEDVCKDCLIEELSEKHPLIQIKIFAGLSLFGKLETEKEKNVFGTVIDVPKHINVRSQVAKGYARRLNEEAFG